MSLAKIKEYKAGARGDRGAVISLPAIYLIDQNISPGDILEIYRGNLSEKFQDVLVIVPKRNQPNETEITN
ncbi:MAG: hypothetical protein PHX51_07240 [Clostridia bacterium]|nr:hypothetical protein [Clostridia bacterium]